MANKKVTYDINFNADLSSLDQLKLALSSLEQKAKNFRIKANGIETTRTELNKVQTTVETLETAIDTCFNPKINTFNFTKFQSILASTGLTIKDIEKQFDKMGTSGKNAFRDFATQAYTSNETLKQTKTFLNQIGETLTNAAKWSIAYGTINKISDGIKSAWSYAVSLDSALNDIRIVTGKSYEEMEKFSRSANKAAKSLGTSTMDYTKGSLIYYQQGLSEKEVAARTAVSAKTANVTGQSMKEVSEELTAVWNGFKATADESESYVDKLAAVAAASASDLEELSTAMSRVASSAATMGINVDQLTAQIATIESVTRQDAASIGTALKTIYARMGDLAIGEQDEFGVALGDVSGKMKQMGIDILDSSGNMRDMGVVIEEVAKKWNSWTSAQQQAAAVALAGKRQYNNLFALFENWDMYESNKEVSENSLGELQKQQDTYMESTKAHLEQLGASFEKVKDALFDNKAINWFIDRLSDVVTLFGQFTENVGGGATLLIGTFSVLANKMSAVIGKNIGGGLYNFVSSLKNSGSNDIEKQAANQIRTQFQDSSDEAIKEMTRIEAQRREQAKYLSEEDNERYNILIRQTNELLKQKDLLNDQQNEVRNVLKSENKRTDEGSLLHGIDTSNIDLESDELFAQLGGLSNEDKDSLKKKIATRRQNIQKNQNFLKGFDSNLDSYISGLDLIGAELPEPGDKATVAQKRNYLKQQNNKAAAQQDYTSLLSKTKYTLQQNGNFISPETRAELKKAYKETQAASKAARKNGKTGIEDSTVRAAAIKQTKILNKALEEQDKNYQAINKSMDESATNMAAVKGALEENHKEVDSLGEKGRWQSIVDNISSVTSAFMGVVTAVLAVKNAVDVLSDDTVEPLQKIGVVISTLIPVITSLLPVILGINKLIQEQIAARAKAVTTTTAETVAAGANAAATVAGERAKQAAIKKTGDESAKAGIKAQLAWLPFLLVTVAIVAVVAAIVAVWKTLENQKSPLEKATEDFEKSKKVLEEFNQVLQDTKTAYNNLLSDIETYEDAKNGIDELKAGTEEWSNAILDANENALDLLNTYPELAQYMSTDSKGLISIDEEGLDKVKQAQREKVQQATAQKYYAQAASLEAQNKLIQAQAEESRYNADNFYYQDIRDAIKENLNRTDITEAERKALNEALDNVNQKLVETDTLVEKAQIEIEKNTNAAMELRKQYAKTILNNEENPYYESSLNQDALAAAFASAIDQVPDIYSSKGTLPDTFKRDLATSLGIESSTIRIDRKEKEVTYNNGSEDTTMSLDAAIEAANTQAAVRVAKQRLEIISKVINEIEASDYGYINSLAGGKSKTIFEDITGKTLNTSKSELTEEQAKVLGFNSLAEFKEAYSNSVAATKEARINAINEIQSYAEKNLVHSEAEYTYTQLKNIKNAVKKAYDGAGKEGSQALTDLLNTVSVKQGDKIAKIASSFNWNDEGAADTFLSKLEEAGIQVDDNNESFTKLLEVIKASNNVLARSVTELDTMLDKVKELTDVVNELSIGDIISDDDYQKIKEIYAGAEKFFIRTTDGWQLISGSVNELKSGYLERFSSLEDAKSYYAKANYIGSKLEGETFDSNSNDADAATKQLQKLIGKTGSFNDSIRFIAEEAGLTEDEIASLQARVYSGLRSGDVKKVNALMAAATQLSQNQENGKYKNPDDVITSYFSSSNSLGGFSSLAQVKNSKEFQDLSKELQDQIITSWRAKYANDLDISYDIFSKFADSQGSEEEAYKQFSFLSTYKDKIEEIDNISSNLTGDAKAQAFRRQNEIYKQSLSYLKDELVITKETLGVQADTTDVLAVIEEYNSKKIDMDDEEKQLWEEFIEKLKEAEEISASMAETVIKTVEAWLDAGLDKADKKQAVREFNEKYIIDDYRGKTGFQLAVDESVDSRYTLSQITSDANLAKIQQYRTAISDLQEKLKGITDENERALVQQQIDDYYESLREVTEDELDNIKSLYDIWSDGWDEITDKCENYANKLEVLNTIYDKQINLNKTLNNNYFSQSLLDAQAKNLQNMIAVYQLSYEQAQKRYQESLKGSSQTERDAAKTAMDAAAQTYLEAVENYYDKLKSNFEATINNIYSQLGIEVDSERWQRTLTKNDDYLDAANAQLNINKISRQYQQAIDAANSINAKTQLREKMESELIKLQDKKNKLSQYEVDRANAVYELTLKQIALEESQRNASKMKLVRDSNGNLTYAFTQDEDTLSKAQQDFEEAQNNLFNIDNNETKSQIEKYYQFQQEAQQELAQAAADGDKERYQELLKYYYDDEEGVISRLQKRLPEIQQNLKSSFKDILPEGDIDSLYTYAEATKVTAASLSKTKEDLETAYTSFAEKFEQFSSEDGVLQNALKKTEELVKTLQTDIYNDNYKNAVQQISATLVQLKDALKNNTQAVLKAAGYIKETPTIDSDGNPIIEGRPKDIKANGSQKTDTVGAATVSDTIGEIINPKSISTKLGNNPKPTLELIPGLTNTSLLPTNTTNNNSVINFYQSNTNNVSNTNELQSVMENMTLGVEQFTHT